jgi:hypothetical protein
VSHNVICLAALLLGFGSTAVAVLTLTYAAKAQRDFEDTLLEEQSEWRISLLEGIEDVFRRQRREARTVPPDCPSEGWEDHRWN